MFGADETGAHRLVVMLAAVVVPLESSKSNKITEAKRIEYATWGPE